MAKKSRRVRKQKRKARLSDAQLAKPGTDTAVGGALTPEQAAEAMSEMKEEYRYVAADLKRVAIIAGALLVVAIILTLVLI